MEAPVAIRIGYQTIPLIILLTAVFYIVICGLCEIILIHEVIPGVIRRIDIDHLHLAKIVLTQKFQDVKVVSLDIKVLSVVKVNTLLAARAQSLIDRSIGSNNCLLLSRPSELVSLLIALYNALRELLPQLVKINGLLSLSVSSGALREAVREEPSDFLYVLVH